MIHVNLFVTVSLCIVLQANFIPSKCNEYDDKGIYPVRKHSFRAPFLDMYESAPTQNLAYWQTVGHSIIKRDYIRLTEDKPHQVGGIWNTDPIKFTNWEVQIEFNISGHGHVYQDGMAFWYVKQPLQQGEVFGNADYFTGLGVFMDTFPNKYHGYHYPYVSTMISNGSVSYDAETDGKRTELAGCQCNTLRNATHPTMISIRYYEGLLKVRTDVAGRNKWLLCFAHRVDLPTGYFLGVTASTGHLSDNHDLIELRTYKLDSPPPTSRDDDSVLLVMPRKGYEFNASPSLKQWSSSCMLLLIWLFVFAF